MTSNALTLAELRLVEHFTRPGFKFADRKRNARAKREIKARLAAMSPVERYADAVRRARTLAACKAYIAAEASLGAPGKPS